MLGLNFRTINPAIRTMPGQGTHSSVACVSRLAVGHTILSETEQRRGEGVSGSRI